jgi:hypothetical protein
MTRFCASTPLKGGRNRTLHKVCASNRQSAHFARKSKDQHRSLARIFRLALNDSLQFRTQAVGTMDAVNIKGEGSRMSNINVVQRDPKQIGRVLLHPD